jgi:hypothetical protein
MTNQSHVPSTEAVAKFLTDTALAGGWHDLVNTEGLPLNATVLIVDDEPVCVAIPVDTRPSPAIAGALRRHTYEGSGLVERYQARAAAGAWEVSSDGTESVLSLR